MGKIIIDRIDKIEADEKKFHYELGALQYLSVGLFSLAGNTRSMEIKKNKEAGLAFHYGSSLGGDLRGTAMLACFVHWYSNSIYNYVRLVRYIYQISTGINHRSGKERDQFYREYLIKVIPEILVWRNKVTAHFAKTDPENDNIATIEASVMFPVSFDKPYFKSGNLKWNSGGETSVLPSWSLTKNFEELSVRYWPDFKLESL